MRSIALAALVAASLSACRRTPSRGEGDAAAAHRISGIVVDAATGLALRGRVVVVGSARALTDERGAFGLGFAPAVYDARVSDADGTTVTVFRGLTRRDPVLVHRSVEERRRKAEHFAQIAGVMRGGGSYPLGDDRAFVEFQSVEQRAHFDLGAGLPGGPEYGPLYLRWIGPSRLSGRLVAYREGREGSAFAFAEQPVTIQDGELARIEVVVSPVPKLPFPVSMAAAPARQDGSGLRIEARKPGQMPTAFRWCPLRDRAFECTAPDLRALGETLCTTLRDGLDAPVEIHECGLPYAAPPEARLPARPVLREPAAGATLGASSRFAWSADEAKIHRVDLEVEWPMRDTPNVHIYTAAESTSWPDGLEVPKRTAVYRLSVVALGPYASLDDAVGPHGLAYPLARSWSAATSHFDVMVWSPNAPGSVDAGFCEWPEDDDVFAGCPGRRVRAMNDLLRYYPELAAPVGVPCVRSCEDAHAFNRGYATYSVAHPSFDGNEPLRLPFSGRSTGHAAGAP